ncbi:hypothetical protein QL285_089719 [Trifolium repens]|nr:hypothetical protein QL285_089719 [Trifolium repens]
MFNSNKKSKGGIRKYDHGMENGVSKVWHISDYDDKERWGAADPQINKKADLNHLRRQNPFSLTDLTTASLSTTQAFRCPLTTLVPRNPPMFQSTNVTSQSTTRLTGSSNPKLDGSS